MAKLGIFAQKLTKSAQKPNFVLSARKKFLEGDKIAERPKIVLLR